MMMYYADHMGNSLFKIVSLLVLK